MAKKTKGRYLKHKTVTPRLSEIMNEAYELLMFANPGAENFVILLGDAKDEDDLTARIIPTSRKNMEELMAGSNNLVEYVVTTDEENRFIKGEIK